MTADISLLDWCRRNGRDYRRVCQGGLLPTLSIDWNGNASVERYGRTVGFAANVGGATVFGPGFVRAGDEIFAREFSHRQYAYAKDLLENWTEAEPTVVDEPSIYLGGWSNWGHWLFQYLTKLAALDDTLAGYQLIVPRDLPITFYACLEKMGFYRYVKIDGPVTGPEIWTVTPGALRDEWMRPCVWKGAVHFVRDRLIGAPDLKKRPKLYISRADAKWRRVKNEEALIAILEAAGYHAIQPEKLSLHVQLDLFGRASSIVTPFGAGSTSVMLAPDDCKVLTFGPSQMDGAMGARLYSDILGQRFHRLRCEAESADAYYAVDLEEVKRLVELET
jgi:capsular polysaccharide biosynthesis protein